MKIHPFNRVIVSEIMARKLREKEKSVGPVRGKVMKVKRTNHKGGKK